MNPAFSVLIFTVCSGAGYGLFMWVLFLQLTGLRLISTSMLIHLGVVGLVLVTIGLLASTLHLANPKNAWRAFNRFRTSWLSREGVFAVLFYPIILSYVFILWMYPSNIIFATTIGIISLVIALLTVICTGMIYASLKPIRQWHNPLTTPIYILFSLTSGVLIYYLLDLFLTKSPDLLLAHSFIYCLVITMIVKFIYFRVIGKPTGTTINEATGLSQAQVRLLDAGHNAETFLTKEFVKKTNAYKLQNLRRAMVISLLILPLVLFYIAKTVQMSELYYLSGVSLFAGLLIERWLFFAEARHVVRLYHGDVQT